MARFWSYRSSALAIGVMLLFMSGSFLTAIGQTPASELNHAAPNFSRTAFDHNRVTLSSFRGKVVLLNFWASWCGPCLIEIPRFVTWQRDYRKLGLQVIGVSMDDEQAPALGIYRKYAVNYPMLMGNEKLGELYGGIMGLPVSFLIDRQGIIRFVHQDVTNLDRMQAEIKSLLDTQ